jgi:hypothetical protein
MKKSRIWIYTVTLLTLFLPVFFIFTSEPSIDRLERQRLFDSTIIADSVHSVGQDISFNSKNKLYKKQLRHKVDSICNSNSIEICPSIRCLTYDDLTGIGLLIRFLDNGLIVLIPVSFYLWILFSIGSILIDKIKTTKIAMIGGLIVDFLMTLTIAVTFTISIYFYVIIIILLITEFHRFKIIKKTPANTVYNP